MRNKSQPRELAPNRTQQFSSLARLMSMRETIFNGGFLWIFNMQFLAVTCKFCRIANRRQKSGRGGSPGIEGCLKRQTHHLAPFHVHLARMLTFQTQQRKANAAAIATERRRLQEALASKVALTFSRIPRGLCEYRHRSSAIRYKLA